MVDRVSECTRETWGNVFKMHIREFFNINCYIIDKEQFEKQQMKKWQNKH